jgi:hypothetical protein
VKTFKKDVVVSSPSDDVGKSTGIRGAVDGVITGRGKEVRTLKPFQESRFLLRGWTAELCTIRLL